MLKTYVENAACDSSVHYNIDLLTRYGEISLSIYNMYFLLDFMERLMTHTTIIKQLKIEYKRAWKIKKRLE